MKLLRLFFVLVVFVAASAKAQKPAWIDNTPQELNYTYKIVEVVSYGDTKDAARVKALENLSSDQQLIEGVRIYQKTQKESTQHGRADTDDAPISGNQGAAQRFHPFLPPWRFL